MWYRAQYDKRKLEHLAHSYSGYPSPAYFHEGKNRYIRLYRGRCYTKLKRNARRYIRHIANRTGIYTKKCSDLWWNWN